LVGTAPISYAYQWQRCDSNGANCANIASATSATYTLTSGDVGSTLVVVRHGQTNSAGSETTFSAANRGRAGRPEHGLLRRLRERRTSQRGRW
jgi:hypothetical protein